MLFGPDTDFHDKDHELFDFHEYPHELVNLAHDRSRRAELREHFARLQEIEHADFA